MEYVILAEERYDGAWAEDVLGVPTDKLYDEGGRIRPEYAEALADLRAEDEARAKEQHPDAEILILDAHERVEWANTPWADVYELDYNA
jgi:hypothetical protein